MIGIELFATLQVTPCYRLEGGIPVHILVTGGTGFIGGHAVKAIRRRHPAARLTVMSRRARPDRDGVRHVAGDVRDEASLRAVTSGVDVVVHAVQFPNHPVERPWRGLTYMEIDGRGTPRLVRACQENGVRRIVYLSGAGAGEGRPEAWFRAKDMAEAAIRQSGLEYVILRPNWIYGPGDRSLNKFVAFARLLPFVPNIGRGTNRVQPVYVLDVAEVIARAVDLPAAANQVFGLGGPEELTMNEVIRAMLRAMGKRRPILGSPPALMKAIGSIIQFFPGAPFSPGTVDFVLQEAPVDPGPAGATFGIEFTPFAQALKQYL